MVKSKSSVFFEVRSKFWNIIQTSFGFKWLIEIRKHLCGTDLDDTRYKWTGNIN
jgi:hypothetical protein